MMVRSFWRVFLCVIIITLLSCIHEPDVKQSSFFNIPYLDKIFHFIMYAFLSFLLMQALFRFRPSGKHIPYIITAGIISFAYGGLMELVQSWLTTSREGDVIDAAFNCAGVIAGIIIFELLRKPVQKA
jgi:VanZ family protein